MEYAYFLRHCILVKFHAYSDLLIKPDWTWAKQLTQCSSVGRFLTRFTLAVSDLVAKREA